MMNRKEMKANRKELLLEELTHTAMKTKEIAELLGIHDGTAWEYVSELRYKGLLYVACYEYTQGGPVAKYMKGNKEDAPYPQIIDKNFSRSERRRAMKKEVLLMSAKKKPRCDIAAAWMRNPIC
jgi:predicted ArsR family transcriptional regulator